MLVFNVKMKRCEERQKAVVRETNECKWRDGYDNYNYYNYYYYMRSYSNDYF